MLIAGYVTAVIAVQFGKGYWSDNRLDIERYSRFCFDALILDTRIE